MGGHLISPLAAWQHSPLRRVVANLLPLAVLFAAAARLPAASPPAWLKPLLAEDISAWSDRYEAVQLLNHNQTRYVGPGRAVELERFAVKILRETGRSAARRPFSYNPDHAKVRAVRAWIVSADGKNTRAFGRDEFVDQIAEVSSHFWNSQRVLLLSGAASRVEIGGTIAYEVEIARDTGFFDASWEFMDELPTLHSAFEVVPSAGGKIEWHHSSARVPVPVPGSEPGALRWQMDRLDPPGSDVPTGFIPNPLRVSARNVAPGALSECLASWEEFSRATAAIIEPRMEAVPAVATKAAELTAGKTARWDRVRALCDFVQRDIAYLSVTIDKDSLAGYRPHPAGECLGNRYGDCKDKAALLCAMLRATGDHGFLVLVFSGNPKVVPPDWPSACFNHAIVAIPADADTPAHWPVVDAPGAGRLVIFDATDPVTPLGVLPSEDQGSHALVVSTRGAGLVQMPSESGQSLGLRREINAEIDSAGKLKASVFEERGCSGAAHHQTLHVQMRDTGFGNYVVKRINSALPLAREIKWHDAWEPAEARYRLTVDFVADRYLRPLGKNRAILNPLVLDTPGGYAPWKTDADGTTWHPGGSSVAVVSIGLPEDYDVEELPKPYRVENSHSSFSLSVRVEGRRIVAERKMITKARFEERADYETSERFWQKIAEAERRPVILKRSTAPASPPPPH